MAKTGRTKRDLSEQAIGVEARKEAEGSRQMLARARGLLLNLQEQDASTGQWSVDTCAAMLNYWQAMFLDADRRIQHARGQDRLRPEHDLKVASEQMGEWEKRKAGAMQSAKVDLLRQILKHLEEQEAQADELLEIEE
jgi:hypothetical protein